MRGERHIQTTAGSHPSGEKLSLRINSQNQSKRARKGIRDRPTLILPSSSLRDCSFRLPSKHHVIITKIMASECPEPTPNGILVSYLRTGKRSAIISDSHRQFRILVKEQKPQRRFLVTGMHEEDTLSWVFGARRGREVNIDRITLLKEFNRYSGNSKADITIKENCWEENG